MITIVICSTEEQTKRPNSWKDSNLEQKSLQRSEGANENIKMLNKIPKEIDAAIKNPNAPMVRLFQTIELELPEDSDTYYNTFNKLYDFLCIM